MKRLLKIDFVFLILGLIFLTMFLIPGTDALDIAVHDTYYVIGWRHISLGTAIYCLISALVYFLLRKFNRKRILWLIYSHLIFGVIVPVLFITWFRASSQTETQKYYNYSAYEDLESVSTSFTDVIGMTISILLILVQGVFLANIIIGIVKKNESLK